MPSGKQHSIKRDTIFRVGGAPRPENQPAQGIPAPETVTRQTAVWLADEEVEWLDAQLAKVKKNGWRNLTRSALIRALIRASMDQEPDLAGVSGERELVERLLARG